jgi:hypothetical protein
VTGRTVDRPIFFVGMPRSGTTMIFEVFTARRDLAWLSQHLQRGPGVPALAMLSRLADISPSMRRAVSRSDQRRPWIERLRVGPVEAYGFWERCCGEKFLYDYLLGAQASQRERECARSTIAKVVRYHGKGRFAAKVTGPGRIAYLSSIFPDARFVHVIRDGRAVVQSLMRVAFWRERDRLHRPAWDNGLTEADFTDWERHGRSPVALAAVQWRRVVESTRAEAAGTAPDRYAEIRYESFLLDPHAVLNAVATACELPYSPEAGRFLDARFQLEDMNVQWREHLDPEDIATLHDLLESTLDDLGYDPRSAGSGWVGPPLTRPFADAPAPSVESGQ